MSAVTYLLAPCNVPTLGLETRIQYAVFSVVTLDFANAFHGKCISMNFANAFSFFGNAFALILKIQFQFSTIINLK
jgi:hypothetical protein